MAADATKLESVNEILVSAGQVPTNSLISTTPEVLTVVALVDKYDRDLQAQGWHWNIEVNQTFSPNVSDEIVLTEDIFEVHESSGSDEPGTLYWPGAVDYAKRGNRLYNVNAATFTFTSDVTLNVIRRVAFENIPQYARAFIVAEATERYYLVSRGEVPNVVREEKLRTRSEMNAAEMRAADANVFRGAGQAWPFLGRH